MPANILIEFVQNIAKRDINILKNIPNSKFLIPIISDIILGNTTLVAPPYAKTKGNEATKGSTNLYLHLRSRTSSLKPNKTIKQMLNKAALYSNCCMIVKFIKI